MVTLTNFFLETEIYTQGHNYYTIVTVSYLAIFAAITTIVSKNPIVSVLSLITLFCTASIYLVILDLVFMGLSYLLVYVGAISILFLFILMLINVRISELATDNANSFVLALLITIIFVVPIYMILPFNSSDINNLNYILNFIEQSLNIDFSWLKLYTTDNFVHSSQGVFIPLEKYSISNGQNYQMWNLFEASTGAVSSTVWDSNLNQTSHITSIANVLYSNFVGLLLLISLILLLAMIGSIVITIRYPKD